MLVVPPPFFSLGGSQHVYATWNPSDKNSIITLSNGNKTATAGNFAVLGIAVDLTNKKAWVFNPINGTWNNDVIANQNPATGTGGATYNISGTIFPAVSMFGGTNGDVATLNCGASSFVNSVPSGFSAWNTVAGTTTTFNPSQTGANITLSNGNLTASDSTGSTWNSTVGNNGASSGKGYFEITVTTVDASNGFIYGIANASQVTNNYVGSTGSTGGGWQAVTGNYGWTAGGSNIGSIVPASTWRCGRANIGETTGKWYWEATVGASFASSSNGLVIGFADSTESLYNYVGVDVHGYSVQAGTGTCRVYHNGVLQTITNHFAAGDTLGLALDFTNTKIWWWVSTVNKWNDDILANQNPATNTGGISFSGLSGIIYPAVAFFNSSVNDQVTGNFGASAFVNTVPSGFNAGIY
jgi:hypothetical protein